MGKFCKGVMRSCTTPGWNADASAARMTAYRDHFTLGWGWGWGGLNQVAPTGPMWRSGSGLERSPRRPHQGNRTSNR